MYIHHVGMEELFLRLRKLLGLRDERAALRARGARPRAALQREGPHAARGARRAEHRPALQRGGSGAAGAQPGAARARAAARGRWRGAGKDVGGFEALPGLVGGGGHPEGLRVGGEQGQDGHADRSGSSALGLHSTFDRGTESSVRAWNCTWKPRFAIKSKK